MENAEDKLLFRCDNQWDLNFIRTRSTGAVFICAAIYGFAKTSKNLSKEQCSYDYSIKVIQLLIISSSSDLTTSWTTFCHQASITNNLG